MEAVLGTLLAVVIVSIISLVIRLLRGVAALLRRPRQQGAVLIARLRDTDCGDPTCGYCAREHAAAAHLQRWFGFASFLVG